MKSAKIMVSLLLVLTLALGGCGAKPADAQGKAAQKPSSSEASEASKASDASAPADAPKSSSEAPKKTSGITVTANFLNGGYCEVKTICVSVAGENDFGEDILKGTTIMAAEVGSASMTFPADKTMLDLQVTGTAGEMFNVLGLDMSKAKDGEDVNIELVLMESGMGSATHMYVPD